MCECLMSFCVSPYVCTVVCVVCVIHCEVLCTLPPCAGGVFVQTAPMFAQGCHDDWAGWPGTLLRLKHRTDQSALKAPSEALFITGNIGLEEKQINCVV